MGCELYTNKNAIPQQNHVKEIRMNTKTVFCMTNQNEDLFYLSARLIKLLLERLHYLKIYK